ncbi:hypothetical protein Gotri_022531 [Gossypium trilobum]|uniref:Protein TORNADO 2-like n=1 Tax=Gossypium trilobum TaxID=34281 RepID=A0A7J9DGI7_9ROSI|nr:hypothetical protein [Gossypium trilobum]
MALSNNVIGAINFVAMLLSIPIIGAGIWLANQPDNSCVKILQWPVIVLGVLILVVALAGFIGGFWRIPWLLIAYLVGMLILIILLACLVVFVYMVTMRGSGHLEPSRAYLEYHLEDFSGWLQRRVRSSFKWERIKICLSSTDICTQLNQTYTMAIDFFNSHLTPIESGCCKPPTECGYTFVNPTNWISPINNIADPDCIQWSNDQTQLCYNCNSCKAGLLANIKQEWRKADIILLITLIALICVYLVGCCAFRNAKTEDIFRKYKQGCRHLCKSSDEICPIFYCLVHENIDFNGKLKLILIKEGTQFIVIRVPLAGLKLGNITLNIFFIFSCTLSLFYAIPFPVICHYSIRFIRPQRKDILIILDLTDMAANSTIVGVINFITLLLSIPVIGAGIWLANEPDNACVKILQWPLIILGTSIAVVALLGFVGGCWRITWLLIFYLFAMFILILVFACLVVLIYLITNQGSGHPAPGRIYLEHDLDDFSGWLRRKVTNPYKWDRIRSCLNSTDMCSELNQRYRIAQDFFNARLTSIQYGCCMPPAECGYSYINPTYWLTPNNTAASMDCLQWSNDQMQLCFHCDSCKAGLLANLTKEWRSVDIILFITLVVLICVYLIGFCFALRKSKTGDTSPRRHKQNT